MVRGQWANLARLHPYSFSKDILGFFFNDHRESGPRFNISSEGPRLGEYIHIFSLLIIFYEIHG